MLDLTIDFLPYASFIAGLSGSLHCLGMCGGLVTASCSGGKDVLKYQMGRLLGYAILGSAAFVMGYMLKSVVSFTWAPFISGIFMGFLFIYWGIQSMSGKKVELPLPGFLRKAYHFLFRNLASRAGNFRSFAIGLISIMLPCGLIYGLIITALALGEYSQIMTSLLFFWIGTLPAMIGAPQLVRKLLNPLKAKLPTVYAFAFIFIGIITIAGRLNSIPSFHAEVHRCH